MIKHTTLPNGIQVVSHRMPTHGTVGVSLQIEVGSRAENENENGISHFLEHMAFKGTTNRSAFDIAAIIEDSGGDINAATGPETTTYHARVLPEHLSMALEVLADIFLNSTFDPEEIEREKHVVIQEIHAYDDRPEDMVFQAFQETAFPNQAVGRNILGTVKSVRAFSRDDLFAFRNKTYCGPNMVLSFAGPVDHDALTQQVTHLFSSVSASPRERDSASRYQGGQVTLSRDIEQAHLVLGFANESLHYRSPDYYTAQCLALILGGTMSSRLFQEAREKRGLCYAIHAFFSSLSDNGLLTVYAATEPEDSTELMKVINGELHKMTGGLLEGELKRAQAQLSFDLVASYESVLGRMTQIGGQTMIFGAPLNKDDILSKIARVSEEGISQLATTLLSSGNPTFASLSAKPLDINMP